MTRRIVKEFVLTHIAAVDRPCQEGAVVTLMKRAFSSKERDKLADKGHAMPDGSYPIKSRKDVQNAVRAFGHKPTAKTKKHIIRNARRVGAVGDLPDHWNVKKYDTALDWLAKQFAVFPFTVESNSDDDDRAFDFDEAFEEQMECERWCNAKEEIHPYIHALKCSIVSIMTDDTIMPEMKCPEIRNSIQQFCNALEPKFGEAIPAMEQVVAKRRARTLRKRVVAGRVEILKARMKKPKKAKAGGAEMRVY